MKKLTTLLLILVLALSSVFSLVGCSEEKGDNNPPTVDNTKYNKRQRRVLAHLKSSTRFCI